MERKEKLELWEEVTLSLSFRKGMSEGSKATATSNRLAPAARNTLIFPVSACSSQVLAIPRPLLVLPLPLSHPHRCNHSHIASYTGESPALTCSEILTPHI